MCFSLVVRTPMSHAGMPSFPPCPQLQLSANAHPGRQQVNQVTRSLPSMWDIWTDSPALNFSLSFSLHQNGHLGVNMWMGAFSLSLPLKLLNQKHFQRFFLELPNVIIDLLMITPELLVFFRLVFWL